MEEIVKESQVMLDSYQSDYDRLNKMFWVEEDEEKKKALDSEIITIGQAMVTLESKILELEHRAKMTNFDPNGLRQFALSIASHAIETQKAVNSYADSVKSARYLASRISSACNLIVSILAKI